MIYYLTDAEHLDGFRFRLRFNTGEEGQVDLRCILTSAPGRFGKTFEESPEAVRDFYLDPWPTLAWKCGYDIAPEHLHSEFERQHLRAVEVSQHQL